MKTTNNTQAVEKWKIEKDIAENAARKLCLKLYEPSHYGSTSDYAAQVLDGRSFYYRKDTRGYFGSRVCSLTTHFAGLVLATVESVQHPSLGKVYRAVMFDLLGNTIYRTKVDGEEFTGFKSLDKAKKDMYRACDDMTATSSVKAEARRIIAEEVANTRAKLKRLLSKA